MLHIDSPMPPVEISSPYALVEGWFSGSPAEFSVVLAGQVMACQRTLRPDLGNERHGFRAFLDLRKIPEGAMTSLPLAILQAGKVVAVCDLGIAPGALTRAAEATTYKQLKRDWLLEHLRPPATAPERTRPSSAKFSAPEFTVAPSECAAINLLDPIFGFSGSLSDKTDGVSAHPYPTLLEDHLASVRQAEGFMALDFGAGFKTIERPDVIYMEVFDYPSTDLLCVGQSLPFPDDTFDAVITLAVLEHVDDPFACANEIVRVLKPGGLLFSGLPFMQPEHGYPDHYFNATRSGHRRLYGRGIEVISHLVDDHQHPFLVLQWILRSYLSGLPEEAQTRLGGMTVDELLRQGYWRSRREPFIRDLSEKARWELASATTIIGRKKAQR